MRRLLILGATAIAIAGCGGDPAPRSEATATATTEARDATAEWAEQATGVCGDHTERLERLLADVDRALLDPEGGPLPASVRRYSAAVDRLFEDLKDIERPDDRRVNQLISRYAQLLTDLSIAKDNLEWNHELGIEFIAAANENGAKAHALAKQLGAEACTGWLVGA